MTMTMQQFRISNKTSGAILGTYAGTDADGALDALASDAGYADYSDMCESLDVPEDEARAEPLIALT